MVMIGKRKPALIDKLESGSAINSSRERDDPNTPKNTPAAGEFLSFTKPKPPSKINW